MPSLKLSGPEALVKAVWEAKSLKVAEINLNYKDQGGRNVTRLLEKYNLDFDRILACKSLEEALQLIPDEAKQQKVSFLKFSLQEIFFAVKGFKNHNKELAALIKEKKEACNDYLQYRYKKTFVFLRDKATDELLKNEFNEDYTAKGKDVIPRSKKRKQVEQVEKEDELPAAKKQKPQKDKVPELTVAEMHKVCRIFRKVGPEHAAQFLGMPVQTFNNRLISKNTKYTDLKGFKKLEHGEAFLKENYHKRTHTYENYTIAQIHLVLMAVKSKSCPEDKELQELYKCLTSSTTHNSAIRAITKILARYGSTIDKLTNLTIDEAHAFFKDNYFDNDLTRLQNKINEEYDKCADAPVKPQEDRKQLSVKLIFETAKKCEFDLTNTATALAYSTKTVKNYLKAFGLEFHNLNSQKTSQISAIQQDIDTGVLEKKPLILAKTAQIQPLKELSLADIHKILLEGKCESRAHAAQLLHVSEQVMVIYLHRYWSTSLKSLMKLSVEKAREEFSRYDDKAPKVKAKACMKKISIAKIHKEIIESKKAGNRISKKDLAFKFYLFSSEMHWFLKTRGITYSTLIDSSIEDLKDIIPGYHDKGLKLKHRPIAHYKESEIKDAVVKNTSINSFALTLGVPPKQLYKVLTNNLEKSEVETLISPIADEIKTDIAYKYAINKELYFFPGEEKSRKKYIKFNKARGKRLFDEKSFTYLESAAECQSKENLLVAIGSPQLGCGELSVCTLANLRQGVVIGEYTGEIIAEGKTATVMQQVEQLDDKYSEYIWIVHLGDGKSKAILTSKQANITAKINSHTDAKCVNVQAEIDSAGRLIYRAIRDISIGEELMVDAGNICTYGVPCVNYPPQNLKYTLAKIAQKFLGQSEKQTAAFYKIDDSESLKEKTISTFRAAKEALSAADELNDEMEIEQSSQPIEIMNTVHVVPPNTDQQHETSVINAEMVDTPESEEEVDVGDNEFDFTNQGSAFINQASSPISHSVEQGTLFASNPVELENTSSSTEAIPILPVNSEPPQAEQYNLEKSQIEPKKVKPDNRKVFANALRIMIAIELKKPHQSKQTLCLQVAKQTGEKAIKYKGDIKLDNYEINEVKPIEGSKTGEYKITLTSKNLLNLLNTESDVSTSVPPVECPVPQSNSVMSPVQWEDDPMEAEQSTSDQLSEQQVQEAMLALLGPFVAAPPLNFEIPENGLPPDNYYDQDNLDPFDMDIFQNEEFDLNDFLLDEGQFALGGEEQSTLDVLGKSNEFTDPNLPLPTKEVTRPRVSQSKGAMSRRQMEFFSLFEREKIIKYFQMDIATLDESLDSLLLVLIKRRDEGPDLGSMTFDLSDPYSQFLSKLIDYFYTHDKKPALSIFGLSRYYATRQNQQVSNRTFSCKVNRAEMVQRISLVVDQMKKALLASNSSTDKINSPSQNKEADLSTVSSLELEMMSEEPNYLAAFSGHYAKEKIEDHFKLDTATLHQRLDSLLSLITEKESTHPDQGTMTVPLTNPNAQFFIELVEYFRQINKKAAVSLFGFSSIYSVRNNNTCTFNCNSVKLKGMKQRVSQVIDQIKQAIPLENNQSQPLTGNSSILFQPPGKTASNKKNHRSAYYRK